MIEVQITEKIRAEVRASMPHGALRGSVTKGERNEIGYLGEKIFELTYPQAQRANSYDYDFVINHNRIDVKTSMVRYQPKGHFTNHVYAFNTAQSCDLYVFCQIFHDLTKGWIIGYCKKSDFFDTAVFYKAGQPAINNKDFIYKGDSYTIRNSELIQINKK